MTQERVKIPAVVYSVSTSGPRGRKKSPVTAPSSIDRRPRVANDPPSLELLEHRVVLSSLGLSAAPFAPSGPGATPALLAPDPGTEGTVSFADFSSGDQSTPIAPRGNNPLPPSVSPDPSLESPVIPPELPAPPGPESPDEIEQGETTLPTDSPGVTLTTTLDESSSPSEDSGLHGEPESGSTRPIPRIVGVSPSGDVETGSIAAIALTFEAPIDPKTFSTDGLTLERFEQGGAFRTLFGPERVARFRVEGDGSRVLLLLDEPLSPGRYRLLLDDDAVFSSIAGGLSIGTRGMVLSEFRVRSVPTPTSPKSPITPPKAPTVNPTDPTTTTPPRSTPESIKRPGGVVLDHAIPIAIVPGEIHQSRGSIDHEADPTRLVAFEMDRQDPADPAPTGFRIRFDGPITRASRDESTALDAFGGLVEVVDAEGRRWPVVAASYDESSASLRLLFAERLAIGSYHVLLPESADLVDLSGRAVLGRDGGRSLGEFQIRTAATTRLPNDLGAIAPKAAIEGVSHRVRAVAGGITTIRFVLSQRENYLLQVKDPSGPFGTRLIGPGGEFPIEIDPGALNGTPLTLEPGVYEFRIANPGDRDLDATFEIRTLETALETLSRNGCGQQPSLSIRLVSAADGEPTARSASIVEARATVGGAAAASLANAPERLDRRGARTIDPTSPAIADDAPGETLATAPLLLTFETSPIGRPTVEPFRVAALPPGSNGAVLALASAGRHLKTPQNFDQPRSFEGPTVGFPPIAALGQSSERLVEDRLERRPSTPKDALGPTTSGRRFSLEDAERMHVARLMSAASLDRDAGVEDPSGIDVPGADDPRIEVSLVRALGIGMVSTWGMKRWTRRRGGRRPARKG